MKIILVIVLVGALGSTSAADSCYRDVGLGCGPASSRLELPTCNALYGAYGSDDFSQAVVTEMQAYASLHIERSYEYLLSSAFFANYQTNREGFTKLFRKLSDEAWQEALSIIQHITKRGRAMDFEVRSRLGPGVLRHTAVELHELGALAKALDVQKELAERAFHIHREATRNRESLHDAEVGEYVEELVERQASWVRTLAGHTTDVKRFAAAGRAAGGVSMALYLFDSYLTKTL